MAKKLEAGSPLPAQSAPGNLLKGLAWGLAGGLLGTLVMDLTLMGTLPVLGQPPLLCFSIVGDTVASFLVLFGLQAAGGVPTGIIAHYVIGPLFGTLFGVLVTTWGALWVSSVWKCILVAVVYVEILSQPILVTTPILLKMELIATLQWFAGSFIMHLIMSLMLGLTVGYGLRLTPPVVKSRAR